MGARRFSKFIYHDVIDLLFIVKYRSCTRNMDHHLHDLRLAQPNNEARPRGRSDRGRLLPTRYKVKKFRHYEAVFCLYGKKTLHTGVRTGCHYLISLSVCLRARLRARLCVSVTFVVFTDCESYTRPISTNPGPMEAGECGMTRGTCFVARRLEVVPVAGLLWISWCVLGAAGFCVF